MRCTWSWRQAGGRSGRVGARAFLVAAPAWLALALAAAAVAGGARAQGTPATPQAGLVVTFGDGSTRAFCVELDRPDTTGLDLLQKSGLDIRTEVSANGTTVCRIEADGCPAPEPCWCHCQTVAGACTYWSYQVLTGDRWVYSQVGPADRKVAAGDVDGWAWGEGSATAGPEPELLTFAEICPEPTAGAQLGRSAADEAAAARAAQAAQAASGRKAAAGSSLAGLAVILAVVLVLLGALYFGRRRESGA
jgi:hypothetical protein